MRERFIKTSPAGFADHELLEMLLYYTNQRRDTNEIAHSLMEAFGSIERLLDADLDRLCSVWGIGEQSALQITPDPFALKTDVQFIFYAALKVGSTILKRYAGVRNKNTRFTAFFHWIIAYFQHQIATQTELQTPVGKIITLIYFLEAAYFAVTDKFQIVKILNAHKIHALA
jgi:hypothetical protein